MITAPTPAMRAVLDQLAAEDANLPDWTGLPAPEGRALAERTNARWNTELPEIAERTDHTLAGCAATRIVPHEDDGHGAILYVHGGGFAFCSRATHERAARALAIAARAPVTTFEYRLAPEHPFPAGLDDVCAAWPAFAAMEAGRKLAFAGDSAGDNLSLAAMLAGVSPRPDCALLFYGVYAVDAERPSYSVFADGPGLTRAKMLHYLDWYVPREARANPLAAPLHADDAALKALPPLYLNIAGIDPLRSDTEALHERLQGLGRNDVCDVFEGVVHGFMQMTKVLPEAREATTRAGAAFRHMTTTKNGRKP